MTRKKAARPPIVTQMRSGRVRGANQNDDVGKNAPSGNVVHRSASDRHRTQTAANRLRSLRMRARTGNAVILMAAPMNRAKLVKETLSSESRGYRKERQERRQHKWRGDAHVAGQHGGVAFLLQFPGIDSQTYEEHENHNANLAQCVQKPEARGGNKYPEA